MKSKLLSNGSCSSVNFKVAPHEVHSGVSSRSQVSFKTIGNFHTGQQGNLAVVNNEHTIRYTIKFTFLSKISFSILNFKSQGECRVNDAAIIHEEYTIKLDQLEDQGSSNMKGEDHLE